MLLFRPMIPLSTIGQNRLGPPEERLSRVPMAKGTWRSELVFFKSGLRERLRPSRSVRSPQGQQSRNRETMALEGNDLGIDGVGRDSIAKCTAVDCPTQYSRSRTFTGRSAGGKACVRHVPIRRLVRRDISPRRWLGRARHAVPLQNGANDLQDFVPLR